ncbi:uncharacterized protein [Ranitomeya imitator]|uniref:uncharacterized protein n=1 Tax=Ranitomeya imitator TaxID=111125 RepID=UPI0037E9019A
MQLVEELVIPDGTHLVTMDVESLYTSIAHQSDRTIEFLDIRLSLERSSIICTLYRKPTSTNSLLHYSSFHPQHLKNGIPKGQFLRLKRNCSKEAEFVQQSRDLSERFKRRGYPQKSISKAYQYARQQDRKSLFKKKIQPREFFTCRSRNLVYAIFCDCPKIYVGQTTQEIRRRMQQHLSNISTAQRDRDKSKTLTSVAAHFLDKHRGKTSSFKVMGLESIRMNIRGGDIHNHLLRCETKWIYELQSLSPKGLNEEFLFTGYYKQL